MPAIRPSTTVAGELRHGPARELGLPSAVPVVIGAGDRPCEVLGAGASAQCPMVSWGTTANVSIPVSVLPDLPPAGLIVTKGALGGWLLEGGLSAAGSAVEWLAALMGVDGDALMEMALTSPPGSNGAMAFAWLGGARAPWWRADVGASFAGLAPHHLPADVARAVVESVAWDVARCLDEAAPGASAAATGATGRKALMLGGGGARVPAWVEVLTAVTGLPARCRRSGEAASAGAALLAAGAIGVELDLDKFDPVVAQTLPDEQDAVVYREIRPRIDAAAARALELGGDGTGGADEAQRHGR
jgi:xylulokinase